MPLLGRDLWFALIASGDDAPGKYYALYITATKNTTAYVQVGGSAPKPVRLTAYRQTTFNIPLSWEMKTSAIAEDKGIHVWSSDADLACYVLSKSSYGSEGFCVIPAIGLGTEYVVASYQANYQLYQDWATEFVIVAN